MKAYVCLFSVLGIAFVGVLGVAADIPQAREDSRFADSLAAQQQAAFARAESRRQVVEEVIAGRLALADAADEFGELNASAPESLMSLLLTFNGHSGRECLCRQVIFHVKAELEGRSAEADAVVPRLEGEMNEYLGENNPGT